MTKYGFYSIVQKSAGIYHVRARARIDLQNLVDGLSLNTEIQERKAVDYRYRIIVDKEIAMNIIVFLGKNIDYSNFKSKIYDTPDQSDKSVAYSNIWAEMYDYQTKTVARHLN